MKILHVAGARPNFVKIASIIHACNNNSNVESVLVHTGQHYSRNMSDTFFKELNIPEPDVNLEVGSGSHTNQTAQIMTRFEPVLVEHDPDAVLLVGDVNSTIACALVAAKLGVKVIHVEAGLRSFDRSMPEEINRVLTDSISDLLFVTEQSGLDNLKNEGVDDGKVFLVGNVMIDTLLANKEKADQSDILEKLGIVSRQYAVVTLHRPSNVDGAKIFNDIIDALEVIQQDMEIMFPIHPRSLKNLEKYGLQSRLQELSNLRLIEPLGYLDFMKLMANARLVCTDSGGMQEETTVLRVPCLTLRKNTERPSTITLGSNRLAGIEPEKILEGYKQVMSDESPSEIPPLWDGHAARRIVEILVKELIGDCCHYA
ncbi:non-hydrolyzing UDP-N-acetylglucosamine 2-epimerase [Planctomycetota bacterium]